MPAGTGYPDWQRLNTRVGNPLVYQTNPATSSYTSPVMYVGLYETVEVVLSPTGTSRYAVTIEFTENPDGTNVVTSQSFIFGDQAGEVVLPLPVVAPYMLISIGTGTPGGSDSYLIAVVPTTNNVTRGFNGQLILGNTGAGSIAASTTVNIVLSPLVSARSVFNWYTTSVNWSVALQFLNASGTWIQYFFDAGTSAFAGNAMIGLPGNPSRMQLINSDTVSRAFQASVTTLV